MSVQFTPLATSLQSTPLATSLQSTPLATSLQSTSLATRLQSTPLATRLQSTPLATSLQSTPLATRLQSTPLATSLQSTPLAMSLQSTPLTSMPCAWSIQLELNRVRRAAISIGFISLLEGLADIFERECTLLPGAAHPDCALQLTHAAGVLRKPYSRDINFSIAPLRTKFVSDDS
uniref:Integrator complex subunit 14 C-terminal domain-containing protein n=1 Tax=Timema bartmani TaxID=61472 RepID=A0A7R9EWJ1_9NEOP|nr:unnamed protein product [Timema bartmani]